MEEKNLRVEEGAGGMTMHDDENLVVVNGQNSNMKIVSFAFERAIDHSLYPVEERFTEKFTSILSKDLKIQGFQKEEIRMLRNQFLELLKRDALNEFQEFMQNERKLFKSTTQNEMNTSDENLASFSNNLGVQKASIETKLRSNILKKSIEAETIRVSAEKEAIDQLDAEIQRLQHLLHSRVQNVIDATMVLENAPQDLKT